MSPILAFLMLTGLLAAGSYITAVLDRAAAGALGAAGAGSVFFAPLRSAAGNLAAQRITTERPDALLWFLAPVSYLALALIGLTVVPFGPSLVVTDLSSGIVVWGMCESLVVIAVFMHGWAANSPLALIGAYRYVAIGLPVMLISMFVLIAAALPAQSLAVTDIVASQKDLWNVARQPLGLPLFLLLGLSLTLRGPFDYADSPDLCGGTTVEVSGPGRAAWQLARLAMLVSFSAMAATVFLGGYLGPWLPGPVWVVLKTLLLLAVLVVLDKLFALMPPSRMLTLVWVVLLPLAFLDLVIAGIEAL
ncbi:NADH-quinone oxidoreductase subunit H [Acuticoccus sp. MNP-M23]|uniref:NADH-quinone oxidoreductase subunit H n=1 Tax=Acuticoccus sp. MNP-M23 TaxID=3072793 RepID=UPI002815A13A|nr:NADH-quinone oxidoreductase subunit H [Acuticoccus sp. MNP-M23]WMS44420.1 NADH-quinone oxidoreductase subunit H [Acuticoccus sp. MNP-M23]